MLGYRVRSDCLPGLHENTLRPVPSTAAWSMSSRCCTYQAAFGECLGNLCVLAVRGGESADSAVRQAGRCSRVTIWETTLEPESGSYRITKKMRMKSSNLSRNPSPRWLLEDTYSGLLIKRQWGCDEASVDADAAGGPAPGLSDSWARQALASPSAQRPQRPSNGARAPLSLVPGGRARRPLFYSAGNLCRGR